MVKNKVSPPPSARPFFDILYGEGISREGEIIEMGVNHKLVISQVRRLVRLQGRKRSARARTTPAIPPRHPKSPRRSKRGSAKPPTVIKPTRSAAGDT